MLNNGKYQSLNILNTNNKLDYMSDDCINALPILAQAGP